MARPRRDLDLIVALILRLPDALAGSADEGISTDSVTTRHQLTEL